MFAGAHNVMNVFYKLKYPNDGEDLHSIVSVLL
jgi:hypothetical protein